jgi:alpha-tubulin suppressor-like RCC1 family protein
MIRLPTGFCLTLSLLVLLACEGASGPGDSFTGLDPINTSVAVGDAHSCLLDVSGQAVCWGKGVDGQLGGDSTPAKAGPALVSGGHIFTALVAGRFHSCGLTPQGETWCWGLDRNAQLGAGTPATGTCAAGICATAPVKVSGNLTFTTLAGSGEETCGLTADGSAWCWGLNDFGQLGASATETCPDGPCSREPLAVSGAHHFARISVSAMGHACGLTEEGAAWCWGLNHQGQLGANMVIEYLETPLLVAGGLRFRNLSAGGLHTCALSGDGTSWCWGIDVLPLLNSGDLAYYLPNKVKTELRFSTIESGRVSECGLTTEGSAYCWGTNGAGEVGTTPIGSTFRFDTPVAMGGGLSFTNLWGENQSYCATASTGGVYCWGQGTNGQLGSGATNSTVPVRVPGT